MPVSEAKKMSEGVAAQAATVGLEFNFDTNIPTNTFDAHRLAKLAEKRGKDHEFTESLLKAHFTDSKHIGNLDFLKDLSAEMGLDVAEVEEVLSGNQYEQNVRADEAEAREIGVQGVPFFVINRKYAISGAQSVETFVQALEKVWEEENEKPVLRAFESKDKTSYCSDEGCD
jgi:protein disulfide-isomerase